MKKPTLQSHLSNLKASESSNPFGPDVLVFKVLNKMFALVSQDEPVVRVTLKSMPGDVDVLTSQFDAIIPGYHMNKQHWITVSLTNEISDNMLLDLCDRSYNLVVEKMSKADKLKLSTT